MRAAGRRGVGSVPVVGVRDAQGAAAALRHVTAIRYVTPLREGGSLPGLMEADDLGTYAV